MRSDIILAAIIFALAVLSVWLLVESEYRGRP